MDVKADPLGLEAVDQFRGQAGQVNAQALDAVVEVRIGGFHHRGAAAIKDVDGRDPARIDVVQETAVGHAGHGGIAGCHGGTALGETASAAVAQDLPAEEQGHPNGQKPKSDKAPALVHGRADPRLEFEQV